MKKLLSFSLIILIILLLSENTYSQKTISNVKEGTNTIEADSIFQVGYNRFTIPIHRNGCIADVWYNNQSGGRYDGNVILYSGGFFISGKNMDVFWGAGNASSARKMDFIAGSIGETSNSPGNKFYYVRRTDTPFGNTWENWSNAVSRGASFYDGNSDGVYNPIDLNNNGIWDLNEDKPDIAGEITIYTKYNDGVITGRSFAGMRPMGIEINQTIYAFKNSTEYPNAADVIFIKYSINNTGTVAATFDSVLFSPWMDADLGEPNDDFSGSDTLNNCVYLYNEAVDEIFGTTTPSLGISVLKTPFDNSFKQEQLKLNATTHFRASYPSLGDPNTVQELRFYQNGLTNQGVRIDPCNWSLGTVKGGVDCHLINPKFIYSGSPVNNIGWLDNQITDQRVMSTVGPFSLNCGVRSEIVIAYVAGRGTSALNSIEVMNSSLNQAREIFNLEFPSVIVDIKVIALFPNEFTLEQNYPNPFNPETKIRFSLSKSEAVRLSVYNVLGQEIKVLVNEEMTSGTHEVSFNGSELTSGVYFYKLTAGERSELKKMVIIK